MFSGQNCGPENAPRRLLYGPGPSMVEPKTYQAMSRPVLGIRDAYFLQILDQLRSGLREVFGTTNHATFTVPAGGSGGMEAALANFVEPRSKLAIFAAGLFADRMSAMARRQGVNVVRLEKPWGEVFTADEAEAFLAREKPSAVAFVQAETSTGAYQSGAAIVPAAKQRGALVIADTVTSLGAMPVELDRIGIDVAFSCTQKGLSCPAGLAPVSISSRAWECLEKRSSEPCVWYLDLRLMAKYFDPPHTYHHTPSPPLYYALWESLKAIQEEGLVQRWKRHEQASEQLRRGLQPLGFRYLVSDPRDRIHHMAAVLPPDGVNEANLREKLLTGFDIEIASGLGQLAGKILRIGTMGPLATDENVAYLINSIERCL